MADKALTVTALTKYIKYKFDEDRHLKDILLEGEVSNFKHNVRGHFYFTLKDDGAQISVVMFKGNAWKVKFKPKEGDHVLIRGYVSVFEKSGSYQVYAESMEEVGLGNLYQAYLKLKDDLEKEGLFAATHKKPLPRFPRQVAVLTSSTGAAVRDIIHIINRRYPLTKILIYPTTVQGDNAKVEVVKHIEAANQNPDNDVIIVGRGGGSIEDLWAFNEEIVARAIYASSVPIVSAVGHETDFTIADFVADMRAPTPSGAAEIVVPDKVTLLRDVAALKSRVYDMTKRSLDLKGKQITQIRERYVLKDPSRIVMPHSKQFEYLYDKLRILHPSKRLLQTQERLGKLEKQMHRNFQVRLQIAKDLWQKKVEHLEYVNPLSIMKKGYTLIKKDGAFVKRVAGVAVDDVVEIQFYDGTVQSKIVNKKKGDS